MASPFDQLDASVAALVTEVQAAITAIQGVPAQITAAVNTALAGGATAQQIADVVNAEVAKLDPATKALTDAVNALNPPPSPPAP